MSDNKDDAIKDILKEAKEALKEPKDFKDHHFLVVDDDIGSRTTVIEYLKSMGYERISQARDGTEGVRMLDRDPTINFIISDWDMPLMDGHSFLQRVKFNPSRAHLPFLIVTSPVSHEAEKVMMAAGSLVDGYLIKPFRGNVLREKIEKILSQVVRGPQRQVIVVDDDADAREMVGEFLKQMGFRDVKGIADGKAALLYLTQNMEKVGLVVSDWEMPEMSGIELLRALKEHPKLRDMPFLMITSQTSVERMKVMQAAQANVDEYLLKPFGLEHFKNRIEGLLEKSRSYGQVRELTLEAVDHLEHGRLGPAQEKFEEILRYTPDNDIALRGMGDIKLKISGADQALPFYKRAIDANPVNAKAYIKLAQVYEQVGWYDKAVSLLQTANHQINFNADLHFHLGMLYNKRKMLEQAQAEFQKALEIQLDHQEARLMLEMLGPKRKE